MNAFKTLYQKIFRTRRAGLRLLLPLFGLVLLAGAAAADWPQWRGPDRTDISKETGLLKDWPKDGPKLLWTYRDAGIGFSGMAVVGDRLYSMGAWDGKEHVFAVDVVETLENTQGGLAQCEI